MAELQCEPVPDWTPGTSRFDWDVFISLNSGPHEIHVCNDGVVTMTFSDPTEAFTAMMAWRLQGYRVHPPDLEWVRNLMEGGTP